MTQPKSVILHVGLHKTATSSIQKTLANNRAALDVRGFRYGQFTNHLGNDHPNHSLPFYVRFADDFHQYTHLVQNRLDPSIEHARFSAELLENLQAAGTLIFSGEEISNLSTGELGQVRSFFETQNCRLRVICFVRSPYAMTCSEGQEWLKTGRRYRVAHRHSMPAAARVKHVFPDTQFYSFQKACTHAEGPVGFFLEAVGLANRSEIALAVANESLSDQAARMIAHINEVAPFIVEGKQNPLRTNFDTSPFWRIEGDKYQLLQSEFMNVEASIRAENDLMRKHLGAEYCDMNFPVRAAPADWDSDGVARLLNALPRVTPYLAVLAYSYLVADEMLDTGVLGDIRKAISTAAHDAARQLLEDDFARVEKNWQRRNRDRAARLNKVATTPLR